MAWLGFRTSVIENKVDLFVMLGNGTSLQSRRGTVGVSAAFGDVTKTSSKSQSPITDPTELSRELTVIAGMSPTSYQAWSVRPRNFLCGQMIELKGAKKPLSCTRRARAIVDTI